MKKTDSKNKQIREKILNNGFKSEELQSLKKIYKGFKEIYNKKITSKTNFQQAITSIAQDALRSLRDGVLIAFIFLGLAIFYQKGFILTLTISLVIIAF